MIDQHLKYVKLIIIIFINYWD